MSFIQEETPVSLIIVRFGKDEPKKADEFTRASSLLALQEDFKVENVSTKLPIDDDEAGTEEAGEKFYLFDSVDKCVGLRRFQRAGRW